MLPDDRDAAHLWRMQRAAQTASAVSEGLTYEVLLSSVRDQLAVTKAIEQIGEVASQVSAAFRDAHPEVPWRQMIGMRNRLVHNYEETDWEVVWTVLQKSVPQLLAVLPHLIPPPPPLAWGAENT
jgi:uncharacterized protein with HEPN domain